MTTYRSLIAASAIALGTSAALAAPAVGLSGNTTLIMFDTESLEVTGTMEVTGVDGLAGIDVRPADKMLYGVSLAGEIVTIDPATGAATVKNTLSEMLPSFENAIVDFNPMADRLRLMATDGTNFRVNPDDGMVTVDGSLAFDEADMHAGETPAIVAAAYTNSFGKPEATAMYDIDATIVALIQQTAPNDGTLAAIGKLGIEGADNYAFDIAATEDLTNTAYLVSGATLYTVNLETGAATAVGEIEGAQTIRDLAILQ
ncbi:DUF4394 domain-containing protein [Aureimonas fodinaquatilis]|uniref:DUF4394 domain-containing protein n=1 Tax=Aureimonas fodinaquatilis TaxID=2565783 RepID=A0A5B0DV72_9HYPH|nr:DUF4394 domain-containing protein [Aureimonas fodinaquatilis]KAA0969099.1 DUF4394 domain-containing protein [Aureimonas fodinaquatilis]